MAKISPTAGTAYVPPDNAPQESTKKQKRSVVANSIIAGSIAGMASVAVFHPFDVVRTKIQTQTFESFSRTTTSSTATAANNNNGPLGILTHTLRNGGLRALYTGLSLPFAAQAVYKATVFTTNRETRRMLAIQRGYSYNPALYRFTLGEYFMCGATGGFVNALLFVCPVEYVRSQLIAQHSRIAASATTSGKRLVEYRRKTPIDVIRETLRRDGVSGLWRGAGVTVLRDSLGCGAFFVMMELGLRYIPIFTHSLTTNNDAHYDEQTPPSSPTLLHTVGSGCLAGFAYWSVSLPLDSLKTLVQSGTADSAWGAWSFLKKREGFVGAGSSLFRGWQVAFGRGMPAAGLSLFTYTSVYRYFDESPQAHGD